MSLFEKYKKWIITSSIVSVLIGFIYYIRSDSTSSEVISTQEEDSIVLEELEKPEAEMKNLESENSVLIIDIKGAIKQPGVYELQTGARVHQLIEMAGGLMNDADELAVNLAAPLEDGMVVYIPKKGEVTTNNQFTLPTDQDGSHGTDKVNINLATSEELQTLTGIGPSKAEAIITYREENGPFTTPEGLLEVSGIGEKSFEKLKEEITIK
jgi:competence protein ComEA